MKVRAMTKPACATLPDRIADVAALGELLSRPTQALIDELATLVNHILILGAGGKMGPTLARMAKRAAPDRTVYGVDGATRADIPVGRIILAAAMVLETIAAGSRGARGLLLMCCNLTGFSHILGRCPRGCVSIGW